MDHPWMATIGLSRCSLSGNGAAFKISISYFRSSASRRLPQRQVTEKPELFRNRSGLVRNRRGIVELAAPPLRRQDAGYFPESAIERSERGKAHVEPNRGDRDAH
jgi:hypothetical protein